MNKRIITIVSCLAVAAFLAGCASSATISNVGVPGSAKNVESGTLGPNTNLKYITSLPVDSACAEQIKILTAANWKETEAMRKETTYSTATYGDGKASMVLMCSETDVSATEKATKVTLTLMAG